MTVSIREAEVHLFEADGQRHVFKVPLRVVMMEGDQLQLKVETTLAGGRFVVKGVDDTAEPECPRRTRRIKA